MQIEFIYPTRDRLSRSSNAVNSKKRKALFPPLNLCVLAALTPPDVEVSLTDENNSTIDFEKPVDLVAITSMSCTAPRMYAIADAFRRRGVPVVLGGSHVSVLPDEAAEHADAVVVGEADDMWRDVVEDARAGSLRRVYRSSVLPSMQNLPIPRRDILKRDGYYFPNTVQTSRGCPFRCSFCSVPLYSGNRYRFRPIDDVVKEISLLEGTNIIGFTDDNIMGDRQRAKELFRALKPLKILWGGQIDMMAAEDDEILHLAHESGCRGVFVGIESISRQSVLEANKGFNHPEKYLQTIRRIHRHGIRILGSFVFGFDHDDEDVFDRTVDFAIKAKLELAQFSILTPLPGTPLYHKLEAEGRLLTKDWWSYSLGEVVFKPAKMSPEALKQGQIRAWKRFYKVKSIVSRTLHLGGWFPAIFVANTVFGGINLASVDKKLALVRRYWEIFDSKVVKREHQAAPKG